MEYATLSALKRSIEHWQENVKATLVEEASVSASDCALCQSFHHRGCEGCPVAAFTNCPGCIDTPYSEVSDAYYEWEDAVGVVENIQARAEFRARAQEELDFLINLLPTTERAKYTEQK